MTSKYAPANDDGDKPYVVEQSGWGRKRARVVYADTVANAKYKAFGRQGVGEYITGCRRATPAEVALHNERRHSTRLPEEFIAARDAALPGTDKENRA